MDTGPPMASNRAATAIVHGRARAKQVRGLARGRKREVTAQPAVSDGRDDPYPEGEFLSIRERLVVAPHWGRVHEETVAPGIQVEAGAILGQLRDGGETSLVVAPLRAVFVRWLVRDGERVAPGSPLALLLSVDAEE